MKGFVAVAAAMAYITVAGCAVGPKQVQLTSSFDRENAQELNRPGVNIVSGSALIRQNGGGVVTCAGLEVRLIPKTAYASERIRALYGNTTRGYNPVFNQIAFTPDHPDYLQLTRTTLCDAQGNFSFNDVADGDFFITSQIVWVVAGAPQGGGLMQSVSVRGGESRQVVLSP